MHWRPLEPIDLARATDAAAARSGNIDSQIDKSGKHGLTGVGSASSSFEREQRQRIRPGIGIDQHHRQHEALDMHPLVRPIARVACSKSSITCFRARSIPPRGREIGLHNIKDATAGRRDRVVS